MQDLHQWITDLHILQCPVLNNIHLRCTLHHRSLILKDIQFSTVIHLKDLHILKVTHRRGTPTVTREDLHRTRDTLVIHPTIIPGHTMSLTWVVHPLFPTAAYHHHQGLFQLLLDLIQVYQEKCHPVRIFLSSNFES